MPDLAIATRTLNGAVQVRLDTPKGISAPEFTVCVAAAIDLVIVASRIAGVYLVDGPTSGPERPGTTRTPVQRSDWAVSEVRYGSPFEIVLTVVGISAPISVVAFTAGKVLKTLAEARLAWEQASAIRRDAAGAGFDQREPSGPAASHPEEDRSERDAVVEALWELNLRRLQKEKGSQGSPVSPTLKREQFEVLVTERLTDPRRRVLREYRTTIDYSE